jgi:hypothetical protein
MRMMLKKQVFICRLAVIKGLTIDKGRSTNYRSLKVFIMTIKQD